MHLTTLKLGGSATRTLVAICSKLHREQELGVGTGLLELLGDQFHRLDRRHACKRFTQDVDAVQFVGMIEQFLLARAAPLDIDCGEDALFDKMTVEA